MRTEEEGLNVWLCGTDYPVRETPPEMLRSGNLKRLVSVGSINPMARRSSQSMEWSDKAVIEEQTDQMSLMDSYYDLTRTRLAKLFMCFEPDGAIKSL